MAHRVKLLGRNILILSCLKNLNKNPRKNKMFTVLNTVAQPSKRLMLELALYLEGSGDTLPDLCERNHVSPEELQDIVANSVFRDDLKKMRVEVREHGLTFRVKAKTMAEELLKTTWELTQDGAASPAVRADMIKSVVEWADLKPRNKGTEQGVAGGVQILINLGENSARVPHTIDVPRVTEDVD